MIFILSLIELRTKLSLDGRPVVGDPLELLVRHDVGQVVELHHYLLSFFPDFFHLLLVQLDLSMGHRANRVLADAWVVLRIFPVHLRVELAFHDFVRFEHIICHLVLDLVQELQVEAVLYEDYLDEVLVQDQRPLDEALLPAIPVEVSPALLVQLYELGVLVVQQRLRRHLLVEELVLEVMAGVHLPLNVLKAQIAPSRAWSEVRRHVVLALEKLHIDVMLNVVHLFYLE